MGSKFEDFDFLRGCQGLKSDFWKQIELNCGAERHPYSMFNVGRSMFDVHLLNRPCTA